MKFVLLLLFTILAVTLGAPHHHPHHSEETEIDGAGEETIAESELTAEKHQAHHVDLGSGLSWYINYITYMKLMIIRSLVG